MLSLIMAKKEDVNQIPKKFRNIDRTFVTHLKESGSKFFMPFPKEVSFIGKEDSENIVLIIRTHWIKYLPSILSSFGLFILPFILGTFVPGLGENVPLYISCLIICLLMSMSVLMYGIIRWFYNVNIITDERVIDYDFHGIFSNVCSEARLEKIEDVTYKQNGLVDSLLDIGTVYIQTAGSKAEIEFDHIIRPKEIQDILYDLLESKEKGEI